MNVAPISAMTKYEAKDALREYKQHRDRYDGKRDWEIERIYRAISKGKMVISVHNAIQSAGLDEKGRPKLAICQASARRCVCLYENDSLTFAIAPEVRWWNKSSLQAKVSVPFQGLRYRDSTLALLPRIPPQYRPHGDTLGNYHMLWEADWQEHPIDPYLLRRIGADAWVVVAEWELTAVEMSVIRARS